MNGSIILATYPVVLKKILLKIRSKQIADNFDVYTVLSVILDAWSEEFHSTLPTSHRSSLSLLVTSL